MNEDRFKFRAWDEENKLFLYAELFPRLENPFLATGEYPSNLTYTVPKKLIWKQCIGLKDKNGKLIYEGDMVKITDKNINIFGQVCWCISRYEVCFNNDSTSFQYSLNIQSNREIIGNIYENQKLLQKP